jgi:hypothetical protein
VSSIYLATGYLDGATLAARTAADLPAHGLRLVEGGDWWAWPAPPPASDYTEKLRAQTLVIRAEHAICFAGRVLVLLTDACGVGTGYEIAYARHMASVPIYWLDCGRTREIPPVLAGYGIRVYSLADLAAKTRENAQ